jgi:hypothetical protein
VTAKESKRPAKVADVLVAVRRHVELGTYRDTRHATERRQERDITLLEVLQVLMGGYHEKRKDELKPGFNAWNYAIRGRTIDKRELRVAVAFAEPGMLIITAIDLSLK